MDANVCFPRTQEVLNRLKDLLRCQFCREMRPPDSVLFYQSCTHFLCTTCALVSVPCPMCPENDEQAKKLCDDKDLAAFYHSVLNKTRFPTREELDELLDNAHSFASQVTVMYCPTSSTTMDGKENSPFSTPRPVGEADVKKPRKKSTASSKLKDTPTTLEQSHQNSRSTDTNKYSEASSVVTPVKKKDQKIKGLTNMKTSECIMKSTPVRKVAIKEQTSSKKKSNVMKRNPKGETLLHLACKKKDLEKMRQLIEAGADANAQDNAGWTALHDSIERGDVNVVKVLLEFGIKVNTPGLDNHTALHLAVQSSHSELTKLLVQHGASIKFRNIYGESPLDIARNTSNTVIEDILLNTEALNTADLSLCLESSEDEEKTVMMFGLDKAEEKNVQKFGDTFDINVTSELAMNVTHIVLLGEKDVPLPWDLISLINCAFWFLEYRWVLDSILSNELKPPEEYEFFSGFKKARENKAAQLPGLFSGCHFHLGGRFDSYDYANSEVPKEEVRALIEKSGGVVLKRAPDPESLALEPTVPHHADPAGGLATCSYFIIYQNKKWDPRPKYNMKHIKTLPFEWLVTCLSRFELVDPGAEPDYADWLKTSAIPMQK